MNEKDTPFIDKIEAEFNKNLLYNPTVRNTIQYHRMGLLTEVQTLKLAINYLAEQVDQLNNTIGDMMRSKTK